MQHKLKFIILNSRSWITTHTHTHTHTHTFEVRIIQQYWKLNTASSRPTLPLQTWHWPLP